MKEFDYDLDYKKLDFTDTETRELYRIGRGEQGVLLARPYTNDICNYWRFKTPDEAIKSSNKDNEYRVFVPTDQKYERAGIKLCKRPEGKKLWKYAQLTEDKLFFPVDLIQYEKQFLVS